MLKNPKDFLGIGWKFPVGTDEFKKIKSSQYEEDIKESCEIILGTAKGERVMRPTFGCGIHEMVFTTLDASSISEIESSVLEALNTWEPRIQVLEVSIDTDESDSGKLLIKLDYIIRSTNSRFNLVYPFYLTEAT